MNARHGLVASTDITAGRPTGVGQSSRPIAAQPFLRASPPTSFVTFASGISIPQRRAALANTSSACGIAAPQPERPEPCLGSAPGARCGVGAKRELTGCRPRRRRSPPEQPSNNCTSARRYLQSTPPSLPTLRTPQQKVHLRRRQGSLAATSLDEPLLSTLGSRPSTPRSAYRFPCRFALSRLSQMEIPSVSLGPDEPPACKGALCLLRHLMPPAIAKLQSRRLQAARNASVKPRRPSPEPLTGGRC